MCLAADACLIFLLRADDFDAYLADLGSDEESPLELSESEVRSKREQIELSWLGGAEVLCRWPADSEVSLTPTLQR